MVLKCIIFHCYSLDICEGDKVSISLLLFLSEWNIHDTGMLDLFCFRTSLFGYIMLHLNFTNPLVRPVVLDVNHVVYQLWLTSNYVIVTHITHSLKYKTQSMKHSSSSLNITYKIRYILHNTATTFESHNNLKIHQ